MACIAVYITAKDVDEAHSLARRLLEKRLVACVNFFPVKSMYWWKNKIENHDEAVIIAKTRSALADKIIAFVKKNHSYDIPCVNIMPIEKGNPDYFKWIDKETRK